MKRCQDIQAELSAYVDGELTPPQRAEVEAHLASCPRCQEELAELKTLGTGLEALPRLQPAPRFLADVRRKIARGDKPEPMTWQDYLFRPFWLKVPLEVAALIAIVAFVMRSGEPVPPENNAGTEMAKAENTESAPNEASSDKQLGAGETAMKPEPANERERPAPEPTASTASTPESAPSPEPKVEPAPLAEAPVAADNATAAGASAPGVAGRRGSGLFSTMTKSTAASGGRVGALSFDGKRRVATPQKAAGALTNAPAPSAPDMPALARELGIDPSKLGEMVVVDAKNPDDVRGEVERLAARCNGNVMVPTPVSGSEDATGRVFFVEVPQEYAVTFKLELLQSTRSSGAADDAKMRDASGLSTGAVPASAVMTNTISGVLTGAEGTNDNATNYPRLELANGVKTREPGTVVLEILVVTPTN